MRPALQFALMLTVALADAIGVVAMCFALIRSKLILFTEADGWLYGAANIGLAVVVWHIVAAAFTHGALALARQWEARA